jgi:hypothetical protein
MPIRVSISRQHAPSDAFSERLVRFHRSSSPLKLQSRLSACDPRRASGATNVHPRQIPRASHGDGDGDEVLTMLKDGVGATEVARKLKIGCASVYRILENATAK